MLLLGLMVLFLVVRLTRFDDPRPLYSAWSYLLGVPTILIAISMITRVLANDAVEKSIQLGFLFSVGLHLLLLLLSVNLVLFSSIGPAEKQKVALVAASNKSKSPQSFQPTILDRESRPDYLKPVQTEQIVVQSTLEPPRRPDESAKLNIEVVKDEIKPTLQETPFIKPRKEASPSQPTISSTSKLLGRPDLRNAFDGHKTKIDVPVIDSSPPTPTKDLQAAETDLTRATTPPRTSIAIADMSKAMLEIERRAVPRQSVGVGMGESKLELSLNGSSAIAGTGPAKRTGASSMFADNAFLSDPRLAMNDGANGKRPDRNVGDSLAVPAANKPIPAVGSEAPGTPDYNFSQELSQAMSTRSDVDKSALRLRSSSDLTSAATGKQSTSLNATLDGPSKAMSVDAFAAPVLDVPRKGLDTIKREIALPEIRDADITFDRLRRPETGGPRIATSAVPIPAAAFSQRLKRNREQEDSVADLGPLGPQTEQAIETGLLFLAKYQRVDGSWHLEDFGENVDIRSDTAATGLSLLSFQGAGYTHRQFQYESVCKRALTWMIKNQRRNGDLYVRTDPKSDGNSWLYSHAIATLALCEAYGMTQDESIKKNAQSAIDFLIQSQDPQGGGWRYQPKIGSDTSVTGWCMMALKSAELSGLRVSKESYRGITKWLESSQASETQKYLYRYNWQATDSPTTRHGRLPTPVMTSVG
ncbi:MAG TPA: prenyltransferase/squalene oxidase repeat-containing protein, partial [Pirellula sp.]|nr:prenyltransferase/squalene oxidase repeat-containing protein [Pirellula sp.]